MKPFQKKAPSGKWGGDKKFGGRSPSDRKPFGRDSRETTMFQATCSECGNACEVPFKPTGRKPILCDRCFKSDGNTSRKRFGESGFDRPAFNERSAHSSYSQSDEFKKIHAKLDAILRALS